ncbi:MAG: hypothetical protein ACRC42_01020 [Mycoplasma sp.]
MFKKKSLQINGIQHEYSFIDNKSDNVIVFLNGINGEMEVIKNYLGPVFTNNYIVTFDNIGQGNNPLPHTANPKKYIDFTINMINALKKEEQFVGKKFILIGESFGASLVIACSIKCPQVADLFFCWNAPTKIANAKVPLHLLIDVSFKTLISLLFNIETYSLKHFSEDLTSNKAILRIQKAKPPILTSNKLNLAVWKLMYKTRDAFKNKRTPNNFYYYQSLEDIMLWKKVASWNIKNATLLETGKHLLSFEDESQIMFDHLEKLMEELC